MSDAAYIHGTDPDEQVRLAVLNDLTNEAFVRFLYPAPTAVVLDVGCGLGILTRRLGRLLPGGIVHGVDASGEQLARAVADLPNVRFQQADAQALPFPDGTFDVVFCRYLLEHVGDPLGVLREMHRVLKPGGKALAQENDVLVNSFDPDCPAFDALWRKFAELQTRLGGDARIGKKLFRLFRAAGFSSVALSVQPEVHAAGQPTFRTWVENLIGNVRPSEGRLIESGLASAEEIRAGLDELRALLTNDTASAYFYWNRAVGVKG
jgi:ubiquinone/menaquinone biosynthesis C-methylase UbiE